MILTRQLVYGDNPQKHLSSPVKIQNRGERMSSVHSVHLIEEGNRRYVNGGERRDRGVAEFWLIVLSSPGRPE